MTWINFLHLYQPANSDAFHIQEAIEKCYRPLFALWEKQPHWRTTINISGCLLLRLEEMGEQELIAQLKRLVKRGQVEVVGSAAYHPLLPLISETEAKAQIKEQEELLQKFLGVSRPLGFFLPEMAYSPKVGRLIKSLGYEWLILDPVLTAEKVDNQILYVDTDSKLRIVFRSRELSNTYVPQAVYTLLQNKENLGATVVTATDAEIYGLRHQDQKELGLLVKSTKIKTKTVSEYSSCLCDVKKIRLHSGSWEATKKEIAANRPFALWQDRRNKIHKILWALADLAQVTVKKYEADENHYWARWHLVRGLASCTFWWASNRDMSHNFGAPAWSPDEIERGINELIRSIRSLHDDTSRATKIKAEKMQLLAKRLIWEKHWRYHF